MAPGELLAEGTYVAGENTYREGSGIFSSRLGLADFVGTKLSVVPLRGAYFPRVDDIVVGRVVDIGMSGWQVDISSPYPAMLPASETIASRERSVKKDLTQFYKVGDLLLAQVIAFDRTRDPLLSTRGHGFGRVTAGRVVRIQPSKIPRIIGGKGSMISMLKKESGCEIIVGQNGIVLISGKKPEDENVAVSAVYMIEREAHTQGLTDRVKAMIQQNLGMTSRAYFEDSSQAN